MINYSKYFYVYPMSLYASLLVFWTIFLSLQKSVNTDREGLWYWLLCLFVLYIILDLAWFYTNCVRCSSPLFCSGCYTDVYDHLTKYYMCVCDDTSAILSIVCLIIAHRYVYCAGLNKLPCNNRCEGSNKGWKLYGSSEYVANRSA